MNKIEHIGVAVSDLSASGKVFELLLGKSPYKLEKVESENVNTLFFHLGESKVELLESTNPESAIARYIEKKGQGIHHVAIAVDDIQYEMNRLKAAGFELINAAPKEGADNKLICFIHPRSAGGILIELCQDIKP